MKMGTIEIWFKDLKEYKQKELLKGMGLEKPEDANLDVFPISYCHTVDEDED